MLGGENQTCTLWHRLCHACVSACSTHCTCGDCTWSLVGGALDQSPRWECGMWFYPEWRIEPFRGHLCQWQVHPLSTRGRDSEVHHVPDILSSKSSVRRGPGLALWQSPSERTRGSGRRTAWTLIWGPRCKACPGCSCLAHCWAFSGRLQCPRLRTHCNWRWGTVLENQTHASCTWGHSCVGTSTVWNHACSEILCSS